MRMKLIEDEDQRIQEHPHVRYATEVILQQDNRPIGTTTEAKPYFIAKHKLYGYKNEI